MEHTARYLGNSKNEYDITTIQNQRSLQSKKREPSHTIGGNASWWTSMENSMSLWESSEIPQRTKNRVSLQSSNPTSGHISRQNYNSKTHMHLNVYISLIQLPRQGKKISTSINRWMNKENMVHAYCGIVLSHKEWNNAVCSNMDGLRDYHTMWNKSGR